MAVLANDRTGMESVPFLSSKKTCSGEPSTAEISSTTKAISADWINHLNLRIALRVCLLLVLVCVGYYAYSEHARLQAVTTEHEQVLRSYSQTVEELTTQTEQNNNLFNELASVKLELATTSSSLATNESTIAGINQRLSTYGFSGPISEFASYTDLIAWLKTDNTHLNLYSSTFTCVDFAFMMSEHAIKEGYRIFPEINPTDDHMECIAPIGNDLYIIEPQTNAVSLLYRKN